MFTRAAFYRSEKWRELLRILKDERSKNGILLCEHCGRTIVRAYDCIGHHVIELTEENVNDWDISLNPENVKLVHHRCHNEIHARFGYQNNKKVYLIYGAPCAGKREYVEEIAGSSDIVLDIDSIYTAISINKRYHNSKELSRNVFGVRDCILDMIKTRTGKWCRAYIIGGYPYVSERERITEMIGAEQIFIESTMEECLARCDREKRGTEKYIYQWFESFVE